MFRIGEFSRLAQVSTRLLRYYDQIGLFAPGHVDDETGYRFYSARQLSQLNRILALKELGLSLEQIAELVAGDVSTSELRGMLLMRRAEAQAAVVEERRKLLRIESRLEQIETAGSLDEDGDVLVKSVPARPAFTRRALFGAPAEALAAVGALIQASLGRNDLQLLVVAHIEDYEPDHLDLEMGFALPVGAKPGAASLPAAPACEELAPTELPALEAAATVVRVGPPDRAHRAAARIAGWVEAHGYELAGPNRELFVERPAPGRLDEAVIEMQFPVRPALDRA